MLLGLVQELLKKTETSVFQLSFEKFAKLESPQAFKVEDQAYPGGPHTGLWPNPLTPPPSSSDLQSSNTISASNPSSHLSSLHARHTDLSVATSSMKGKQKFCLYF